jgi:hypothetical protein
VYDTFYWHFFNPLLLFLVMTGVPMCVAIFLLLSLAQILTANPAATQHVHNHHHGKEREEDGAFSPRDHLHHGEDGTHHAEFDHEAILGNFFLSR